MIEFIMNNGFALGIIIGLVIGIIIGLLAAVVIGGNYENENKQERNGK